MRARFLSTWGTTLILMFASLISYLDRNTLAVLAPTILRDTHLSAEQYGWVISAFSIAYMIGNPVWGYTLDRIGLTSGLALAVGLWTIASAAHAAVTGVAGFAAARAMLGWAEGATFPAGLRGSVESLPIEKRARGMALAYSGGSLGAIVTPFIVTPIALRFGWRSAFWFTGLAGAVWIAVWLLHRRRCAEVQTAKHSPASLPSVREGRFWALVLAYALGAAPIALGIYAAPVYLSRALGISQEELGRVLFVPPLGWEVGYFFWAWIADRFARAEARPVGLLAALAVLGLPLAGITAAPSLALTMALFFWSMFVAAGFIVLALHYGRLVYPVRHTGLIAGVAAGSWSALVAVIMPFVGWLLDQSRYGEAFAFAALLPVLGFCGWWSCSRATPAASSAARA
ncbi:MAG TPA: MFS transporter [Bryobacteraceae bacterium]|nr:MFS transporter [Bryobacteraceae bacterium]